jgi:hypothetical protein
MVRLSATASRRWQSRRSSLQRDHPGRISTSNASLARSADRSAESVSIISSSSTSVTCAVCCHHIFSIIIRPGRISRSTRIVRTLGQYSGLLRARSSRSPRSGDCIIATNAAPHKLPSLRHRRAHSALKVFSIFDQSTRRNRDQHLARSFRQCQLTYWTDAKSSATCFNGEPFPQRYIFEQGQEPAHVRSRTPL